VTNPSSDPIPSARYIHIGEMLNALQNAKGIKFGLATSHLANLMTTLDHVGLPYPKKNLDASLKEIEQLSANLYHQKGDLPEYTAADLSKLIVIAHETITGAAESRLTIALDTGGVSAKLRSLPQQLTNLKMTKLNAAQTDLHAETTRCLECGVYRSAAVMGWNLAFDYIRQWVFDKHLLAFNRELVSNYIKKSNQQPLYAAITDYADFLKGDSPGERTVLDTCNLASIIFGNVHDDLKGHLRQRNQYAHPSGKEPTAIQVNAYLEHLIDIVLGKPFN
jgi:hypothetical protein